MNEAFDHPSFQPTTLDQIWQWFHRLIAGYSLLFGVTYWVRLIGVFEGSAWRFDLMPPQWQVVSVVLAVLFPFAASGLWMMASWGPVIWFLCALTEIVMFVGFPDLFGSNWTIVAAHLMVAAIYAAFRVAFLLRARRDAD